MLDIESRMGIAEVAKTLGLSPTSIYRNPRLYGGVKLGGRWHFFREHVAEAIEMAKEDQQDASQANKESADILLRKSNTQK